MNKTASSVFESSGYIRTRTAYTAECMFEYIITLLVADPFITKLLLYIGLEYSTISIIQSLLSVAFLFQLFALFVVRRIKNVKRVATTVHFVGQLLFLSLYFVPFLPIMPENKGVIIIVCFLSAYFGKYLVSLVIWHWGNGFVDPGKRGRFSATKEMISLIFGAVVTLVMGVVVDYYEKIGDLKTGFIITAAVMVFACMCDLICLLLMKNRTVKTKETEPEESVSLVLKKLFKNKKFVYVLITACLWQGANYALVGTLATYKQVELAMSVGLIQVINIGGQLSRIAMSIPIGKYTDKRSFTKGLTLGLSIASTAFFINLFTTPQTWWLIIIYTVLYNVALAGIEQNLSNIIYNFVEDKYFVQASALKNSISGVVGFLIALISGIVMKTVQANGNEILSVHLYAQQLLSFVSLALAVTAILFARKYLDNKKTADK